MEEHVEVVDVRKLMTRLRATAFPIPSHLLRIISIAAQQATTSYIYKIYRHGIGY